MRSYIKVDNFTGQAMTRAALNSRVPLEVLVEYVAGAGLAFGRNNELGPLGELPCSPVVRDRIDALVKPDMVNDLMTRGLLALGQVHKYAGDKLHIGPDYKRSPEEADTAIEERVEELLALPREFLADYLRVALGGTSQVGRAYKAPPPLNPPKPEEPKPKGKSPLSKYKVG